MAGWHFTKWSKNGMSNQDIKIRILAQDKSKQALSGVRASLGRVKDAAFSVQGALIGIGAGAAVKSIVTTAAEVESLKVRLKFLTGSTKDAGVAFKVMNEYASSVPFALADIERASPSLLTVADSVDELNELLQITGDIAAVSGLSFDETAMQMQRAFAGGIAGADQFRERGVSAFLGFEAGVSYSAEKTKEKIKAMWRDGTTTAKGATGELSKTFTGQVSMMQDAWREMKLVIADTGVFAEAGNVIKGITEGLRDPSFKDGVKVFSENLLDLYKFTVANKDILLTIGAMWLGAKAGDVFGKRGSAIGAMGAGLAMYNKEARTALGLGLGQSESGNFEKIAGNIDKLGKKLRGLYVEQAFLQSQLKQDGFWALIMQVPRENRLTSVNADIEETLELATAAQIKISNLANAVTESTSTAMSKEEAEIQAILDKEMDEINAFYERLAQRDYINSMQPVVGGIDLTGQQFIQEMNAAEVEIQAILDKSFEAAYAVKTEWQSMGEAIKTSWESVSDSIENTLADTIMGLTSWRDATKLILREVAREFIKTYMIKGMVSNISTGIGNFFGLEPRADGGPVSAGSTYLVGERGPEIFTPRQSGSIIPNEQIGGSSNINVNFNITANDTRGFDQLLQQRRGQIVGIINQAMNDRGQRAIA